jgi:hypothetical protein
VKDAVDPFDGRGNRRLVRNVPLNELDARAKRLKVSLMTGAQIVEHSDAIAATHQGFCNVRADETGSTSDQKCAHK